jgi:hypothetical protein
MGNIGPGELLVISLIFGLLVGLPAVGLTLFWLFVVRKRPK